MHRRGLKEVLEMRPDIGYLRPRAAEIADRKRMLVAESVVDLRQSIETVVGVERVSEIIVRRRRSRAAVSGKNREQVRRYGIHWDTILGQHSVTGRDPGRRRRRVENGFPGDRELNFSGQEKERLVLDDRPADREPRLIITNLLRPASVRQQR